MIYGDFQLINAEKIYNYLAIEDSLQPSDAIVGFGHFDLAIPQKCSDLYKVKMGKKIIFTGGIGAGSADFKEAEAIEFKNELLKIMPDFQKDNLILEDKSTNTGENISFTKDLLNKNFPDFTFGKFIKTAILVASPYRQRRVYLTVKKYFPELNFFNAPPKSTFETQIDLFNSKNEDLVKHMLGELDRLEKYPQLGYIIGEEIPEDIIESRKLLKNHLQQIV